jgi:hypothetical protein
MINRIAHGNVSRHQKNFSFLGQKWNYDSVDTHIHPFAQAATAISRINTVPATCRNLANIRCANHRLAQLLRLVD